MQTEIQGHVYNSDTVCRFTYLLIILNNVHLQFRVTSALTRTNGIHAANSRPGRKLKILTCTSCFLQVPQTKSRSLGDLMVLTHIQRKWYFTTQSNCNATFHPGSQELWKQQVNFGLFRTLRKQSQRITPSQRWKISTHGKMFMLNMQAFINSHVPR